MRILGKNQAHEAYRVAIDIGGTEIVALVPDALLSAQYGQDSRVSHEAAYEWISSNRHDVTDAILARHKGSTPQARFAQITLESLP